MATEVIVPAVMSYDGTQHRWNDTSEPNHGIDEGEHVNTFIPIVKDVVSVASYTVNYANTNLSLAKDWATKLTTEVVIGEGYSAKQYALNAAISEANAAASAAAAAQQANTLTATSTTSLTISTGSKTITTQSGEQFVAGQFVTIAQNGAPSNFMYGQVTSYIGTTLIVNVTATDGSGTIADWIISLSGLQGVAGNAVNNGSATNLNGFIFGSNGKLTAVTLDDTIYQVPNLDNFIFNSGVI